MRELQLQGQPSYSLYGIMCLGFGPQMQEQKKSAEEVDRRNTEVQDWLDHITPELVNTTKGLLLKHFPHIGEWFML